MASHDDPTRPIGTFQLLALGVNGIVGVGIFFVPAVMAVHAPGRGLVAVFALTGVALLPVAFAFATLGRRFDEDGGPVVFARAAFGKEFAALVGWVTYVSAFFSTSAVLVGLTQAVAPTLGLDGPLARRFASLTLLTVLALVVASGLRLSARIWTSLTVLKLLPLLLLLAAWAASSEALAPPAPAVPGARWLRAGLTAMFACQGFEIVPVIAGQVRASARAVPRATVGSLVVSVSLYVALAWACVSALPDLAASGAPLADAASVLGGTGLARLVAAGTSVSALGITLGMMVTTPRYLSALAAGERGILGLDRLSADGVPRRAVLATWLFVALVVTLGELGELFVLSSLGVLMQYGVTAAALAALAWRRERGLRPRDAWSAPLTLAAALALAVFGATAREALVALGVVVVGLVALLFARRVAPPAASAP
jgi:basic amino acid/polyamine antiporter, APA family